MSYISIIVPAFHLNTVDINEINNYCCSQFNISPENFQLVEFENNKYKDKINYGIIFKESNLSLQTIEQLIYERNCIQNLSEKVFESLQLTTKKINDLEYLINSRKDLMHNLEKKFYQKNIDKEEEKNNNILDSLKDNELMQTFLLYRSILESAINSYIDANGKHKIFKQEIDIIYSDTCKLFYTYHMQLIKDSLEYLRKLKNTMNSKIIYFHGLPANLIKNAGETDFKTKNKGR